MNLQSDTTVHAIPASSIQSSAPKSTITKRNTKAKKGLGAKKLGGQKVTKVDFEKLEKNAEEADKVQHRISVSSAHSDEKSNNSESNVQSLRLAYQDLDVKEKQDNMKLSKMDERKKEQASRLGMGMGRTDDVSHSLDMVTINQENPKKNSRRGRYRDQNDIFYDSYSTRTSRSKWNESGSDEDDDFSRFTKHDFSYTSKKSSGVDKEPETITVTPIGDDRHVSSGMFAANTTTTTEPKNNRQRKSGPTKSSNLDKFDSSKFSGAKAISSDMMFGGDHTQKFEQDQRMRSFEGRSSISSDDFYGSSSTRRSNQGSSQVPDVSDIKDGVREGVRSVAGKLSVMASGIANTIQDRYG